jgi:flagellar motor switch/type III secretory pathway protein FliN
MSGIGQPPGIHGQGPSANALAACTRDEDPRAREATVAVAGIPDPTESRQTRTVRLEIGRRSLPRMEAQGLGSGSVVRLAEHSGDPVQVYVDQQLIARGQLLLQEGRLSVRITELVHSNNP